jgi:Ser/Thr protein kinase RdoA (MazF antagonist)
MGVDLELEAVAEHWGFALREAPVRLDGGFHNRLIRCGKFVVRFEQRTVESVEWEHDLLRWLGEAVPEVVVPRIATDGSSFLMVGKGIATVLAYVEGGRSEALGAPDLLARLHQRGAAWSRRDPRPGRPSLRDLDWERNDWWDWELITKPPGLERAYEDLRDWVGSSPSLLTLPIHGDFGVENLIVRDRTIAAVIDWEYARLEWAALELSAAATRLSLDAPEQFIKAYQKAGGPAEAEADTTRQGMRLWWLSNALYSLTSAARDEPYSQEWVEFALTKLRQT